MTFLPRILLGMVGFFHDIQTQQDIQSGRIGLPLSELGGVSDIFAVPLLTIFLKAFGTPNFAPPDWWPVLTFRIQNPVDPTAWIGQEGNKPIDPRSDPFYHPDISTYQNKKNGDILDIREVGLSIIWAEAAKSYQISYRTESTLGWPQADITTVMIPYKPNGKVVSYQMWEDSASLQCAPSYSMVTGVSDPTMNLLLLLGYVVNVPDHEGKNSSFVAGIKEGKSTLDSLKAYLSAREQIGLDTDSYDKIVMWGYSGGSIATGHAAEAQPTYAPELKDNLVAGVVGGYVTNATQVVHTISGGVFAGLGISGMYGFATEYPGVQQVLDEWIRPGIRWRWNQAGKVCALENLINNMLQNVWSYTKDKTGAALFRDPRVATALEGEQLGVNGAPQFPMIIYQGVQDQIVDVNLVDRTVNNYCKAGVRVDYYRLGALEHVTTEIVSIPDGLKWVAQLFDGYVPAPCTSIADATKRTSLTYSPSSPEYKDLVYGNWEQAGVLDLDGIRPKSS